MEKMRANVFRGIGINEIHIEEVNRPRAGAGEAVIRVTLMTICGTDLHIVRGELRTCSVDCPIVSGADHLPSRNRQKISSCADFPGSMPGPERSHRPGRRACLWERS